MGKSRKCPSCKKNMAFFDMDNSTWWQCMSEWCPMFEMPQDLKGK